ncbi:MAG: type VI secretion system baseplate subunit TssG [Desulfovermiculus sp.]
MAGQTRRASPSIAQHLLDRPQAYAFVQVVRLLKLITGQTSGQALQDFLAHTLRVRPDLSLGFPGTDVCGLEVLDNGDRKQYRITASFLGLYGSSSPLPSFYTEELLDEARDDFSGLRDFLDILNNPFFIKLYRAWARNRLAVRIVEEEDPEALERAYCLIGLGHTSLREQCTESYKILRYTGLHTQYPRSALGLQTMLTDRLGGIAVQITQCVPQKLSVPADQRLRLGQNCNTLGEETTLGSEVMDCMGKFRLNIGPLDAADFQRLLPGSALHAALIEHIAMFQVQPLDYDLSLTVHPEERPPATLGSEAWSRLGLDTWLIAGSWNQPGTVSFACKAGYHKGAAAKPSLSAELNPGESL